MHGGHPAQRSVVAVIILGLFIIVVCGWVLAVWAENRDLLDPAADSAESAVMVEE